MRIEADTKQTRSPPQMEKHGGSIHVNVNISTNIVKKKPQISIISAPLIVSASFQSS